MTSVGKRGIYPRREPAAKPPGFFVQRSPPARSPRPAGDRELHAAAFGRAAAVMRDRRHIADRGDRKTDRLEGAQRRFTPRARALDLDVEGAHAMLHGLAPGILGGNLGGIGRRFARPLEALA